MGARPPRDCTGFAAAAFAAAMLLAAAGCPPKTRGPLAGTPEAWPFRPVSLSFHALTRSESDDAAEGLLVRIEFRDAEGDPVKAVGTLAISIACDAAVPPASEHRFDLADAATNRRLFDPVTQTYRVRIASPWSASPSPGDQIDLAATLEQQAGEISGRTRIAW